MPLLRIDYRDRFSANRGARRDEGYEEGDRRAIGDGLVAGGTDSARGAGTDPEGDRGRGSGIAGRVRQRKGAGWAAGGGEEWLSAGARGTHGDRQCRGTGAESARPLGWWHQVQLSAGAAVCSPLPARIGGIAVAVPERHLDRRHARGADGAAWRRGQGFEPERRFSPEERMGDRIRRLDEAGSIGQPLRLLVGRWHSYRAAAGKRRSAMPAGHHWCDAGRPERARHDWRRPARIQGILARCLARPCRARLGRRPFACRGRRRAGVLGCARRSIS